MNKVPEKLINFRVYLEGVDLLGVGDVELPDLETLSDTVSGAGIAGEIESPTPGHFKPMSLKIKWRTLNADLTSLARTKAHQLDIRGSVQAYDAGAGGYENYAVRVVAKGIPKKIGLGKMEPGKPMDNDSEFEVVYLKVSLDGSDVIEIDKFNFICVINGEDYLSDVREHLGM